MRVRTIMISGIVVGTLLGFAIKIGKEESPVSRLQESCSSSSVNTIVQLRKQLASQRDISEMFAKECLQLTYLTCNKMPGKDKRKVER